MSLGGFVIVTAWLLAAYIIGMGAIFWHEKNKKKKDK